MGVSTPENFQLITSIAAGISITLSNVIATGIGISVRQRREHEHEIAAWAARAAQLGSVNGTQPDRPGNARRRGALADGDDQPVGRGRRRGQEGPGARRGGARRSSPGPAAPRWRTCGASWACCATTSAAGQAPREPLAAGDNLAKLLEGFRTAGLPLHYTHTGPSLPDDAAFQLTVYRIVQESLTNVLRYGRSLSRVDVDIVAGRFHGHH